MKRLGFAILLCTVSVMALTQGVARDSKDYLSFLPQEGLDKLYSSGELTNIAGNINELPLWQKSPLADAIRAKVKGLDSTVSAEGFFLIDKPNVAPEDLDPKIFNAFTAFSTLKGLQVYSVSQGHMETFFFDASLVDPANRSQRLQDTIVTTVPVQAEYVVYEKEEKTGESFAKFNFDYDKENDTFAVAVTNLTGINWLIFTLVKPGNLKTLFYVVPCQDRLILYGLTMAGTDHLFGLERTKQKSFYYRMRALVSWFSDNVKK
jgi:hypothetical protein